MERARLGAVLAAAFLSSGIGYFASCEFGPSAPASLIKSTPHGSIEVLGDGIGPVHFGVSESTTIASLGVLFDESFTTVTSAAGENCGVTGTASSRNVLVTFVSGKFAGYEIGTSGGEIVPAPSVKTTKGLRIGDTVAAARALYGSSFSTTAAQGGSWTAATDSGKVYGLLRDPPEAGTHDKVDLVAAGYVGCPAMTP